MSFNYREAIIFTDGSSRGNPGPGGYAAIVIFPESNDTRGELKVACPPLPSASCDSRRESEKLKVQEIGGREEHTTNNRMELCAAIEALAFLKGPTLNREKGRTLVYSDSSYLINGITKWVRGWQKNGWKTAGKKDVENRDLWERLVEAAADHEVKWKLVTGHAGVAGNIRCDEIATAFADGKQAELYSGVLKNYRIRNILDVQGRTLESEEGSTFGDFRNSGQSRKFRKAAYSYVSMVNGAIHADKTWGACEARVKGKRGAKYKKVFSPEEERELIRKWLEQLEQSGKKSEK